jgi:hypothetical protein
MSEGVGSDGTAVRKRGAKLVGIAILLVVLVLLLMGWLGPDQGVYPGWLQAIVHCGWLASIIAFAVGLFHAIVGAPGLGPFRLVRTPIAVLLGIGATGIGALGGFVLHASMSYEGDRTRAGDDDVDWDWD